MDTITECSDLDSDCTMDESDCDINNDGSNGQSDTQPVYSNTGCDTRDTVESRDMYDVSDTDDTDDTHDGYIKPVLNNNFILPMETEDARTNVQHSVDDTELKKSKREKKNGRFYKFVKKHFLQRKSGSNDVKEINILPEGDENKWARRSAGSAASRSSEETITSEDDRLEVVHDMAEEEMLDV